MRRDTWTLGLVLIGMASWASSSNLPAGELSPAERGHQALFGKTYTPAVSSVRAYESVWKKWGVKEKPADYSRALGQRYGLHTAPHDNQGLPMGLRYGPGLFGKGITYDCLLCHAGAVAGQSYVGAPNSSIDLQALFEELAGMDGINLMTPYSLTTVRGTVEAGASVAFLMQFRDTELNHRAPVKLNYRADLCEDTPAWWLLKKKKTMYHTGSTDARSVRSLMPFLLSPLNSGKFIRDQEAAFADLRAYILSLEAPRYPFPVNAARAAHGGDLFREHCAKCHGTYGPGATYPSKIVPLEVIGTDRSLAESVLVETGEYYLKSWFARERSPSGELYENQMPIGYQAPPLDGVWATAPYFHNASAPTLYHVLNSKARPRVFTRSYLTGREDYDPVRVGVRTTALEGPPAANLSAIERRQIYDTTQPGRGNGGHLFGDVLTEEERLAVIEYLKTL